MMSGEGQMMQTRHHGFTRPKRSAIRSSRDLASYVIFVSILSLAACGVAVYLIGSPLKELVEIRRLQNLVAVTQTSTAEYVMPLMRIGLGLFILSLAVILSAAAWDLSGSE